MADEVEVVEGAPVVKQLSKQRAERITRQIREGIESVPVLLLEAFEGQAHRALGYETWDEYVQTEFLMTRENAYRAIRGARASRELTEVAGVPVAVSQRAAVAFEKQRDSLLAQVREVAAGVPEDGRAQAVSQLVEDATVTRASRAGRRDGDGVRPSVPTWLKPVWDDVERAAAQQGSNPFDFVVKTLSGVIAEMGLPPVEAPEKPARARRARQSAGRDATAQEGDRDEQPTVPAASDPFAPAG